MRNLTKMLMSSTIALGLAACSVEDTYDDPPKTSKVPEDIEHDEQIGLDEEIPATEEAMGPAADAAIEVPDADDTPIGKSYVTFSQLCKAPPSVSAKETVGKLLELVGSDDCERAEKELTQQKFLDLTGLQIRDVSPLATLRQLEGLFLANNNIRNASPLAELEKLEYLSIFNNRVEDFSALKLPHLKIVLASQNLDANLPLSDTLTHAWYGLNGGEPPFLAEGAVKEDAGKLTWPAGENKCRGVWTYDEYRSCRHKNHGRDRAKPVRQADGKVCGFREKNRTCWHGNVPDITINKDFFLRRKNTPKSHEEVLNHCRQQAPALGSHKHIESIRIVDEVRGRDCYRRNRLNQCIRWYKNVAGTCRIQINTKVRGSHSSCGKEPDRSRPLTCVVGYEHAKSATAACGKDQRFTSRLADISDLLKDKALTNFACSTCDNLPVDSVENIAAKFGCLKSRYEAVVQNFELSILSDLEAFRAQLSSTPTDAMLEYIEVVRSLKDLFAKYPASVDEKMVDFILQVHAQAPEIGLKI